MSKSGIACYHHGYDFDWWRCNVEEYVGRPPSPFPAPFETPRLTREDSQDATYGVRTLAGTVGTNNGVANHTGMTNGNANNTGMTNGEGCCSAEDYARRLYWPWCQGPEDEMDGLSDLGDRDLNSGLSGKKSTTPKVPQKRPPWCPAKLPNKWGIAGHPPPYTNYCKETLFNTRTADPMKVSIKTTF